MVAIGRMPQAVDLLIYAGDIFRWWLEFDDGTDPESMAGFTWAAQVRDSPTSATILASFAVDVTGALDGIVGIMLTPTQTRDLLPTGEGKSSKTLTWDLQATEIADPLNVRTPFAGSVTVTLDRTRLP